MQSSKRKQFQVREDQSTLLLETDIKEEAIAAWIAFHRQRPKRYHEVYELIDGVYIGFRQYKPGDIVR
jgi:hypothetical protein